MYQEKTSKKRNGSRIYYKKLGQVAHIFVIVISYKHWCSEILKEGFKRAKNVERTHNLTEENQITVNNLEKNPLTWKKTVNVDTRRLSISQSEEHINGMKEEI